jgi:hypothetical protein
LRPVFLIAPDGESRVDGIVIASDRLSDVSVVPRRSEIELALLHLECVRVSIESAIVTAESTREILGEVLAVDLILIKEEISHHVFADAVLDRDAIELNFNLDRLAEAREVLDVDHGSPVSLGLSVFQVLE